MRRARQRPLFLLVPFALVLCAIAALALPPKAEAVIRLGSANMISLTNGLVGYWTFDGSVTDWNAKTTRDLSGQGNHGLFNAFMPTSSAAAAGKIGQGLTLTSDNSLVSTVSTAILDTDFHTISFWMRINKNPTDWMQVFVYP